MTDPLSEFRLDGDVAVVTGGAASGEDAHAVDVADEAQVRTAFARVVAQHGRLDILFNNAGIAIRRPTVDLTLDDWNKVMAVYQATNGAG